MSLKTLLGSKYKEGMTAEEITSALEEIEFPDMSGFIKKSQFDKTASELADWKKKYNAKLTEEEAKAQAEEEARTKLEADYNELKKKVEIADHTKRFLGLGYDEKLAEATARAWYEGDSDTVFKNQAKFLEAQKQSITAEFLKNTPTPPSGEQDNGMSKDAFKKLSLSEKTKLYNEQPDVYNQMVEK